jgi:hypothetical protein
MDRSRKTLLLLVICIAIVRVLITGPVHADKIKPGPDLLQDAVQRLFVPGVVGRRLLALELVSKVVQRTGWMREREPIFRALCQPMFVLVVSSFAGACSSREKEAQLT